MHIMNPVIERAGEFVKEERDGTVAHYNKVHQFVSCGCGWHMWITPEALGDALVGVWFDNMEAENHWIDHVERIAAFSVAG